MSQILSLFRDGDYFRRLFHLAWPIALQSLTMSLLNMMSSLLVGQLGDRPVAAVALAGQVAFLFNLFLFGVNSGAAMFIAQLWGKQDVASIRRVLGLSLFLGLVIGAGFLAAAEFFPEIVLSFYTRDPQVIALGTMYLRLFGPVFFFFAITSSFSSALRSIGEVRLPVAVNVAALALNLLISYLLIFGALGFPALGVQGAGLGAAISRGLECAALLFVIYRRRTPVAAGLGELFHIDFSFAGKVLRPVLPVAINEVLWSLGITSYNAIYGQMGTDSIAAISVAATLDGLAITAFIGIGHATAILVGHQIGAGNEREAQRISARSLILAALGGLLMGGVVLLVSGPFLTLYKVSPQVIAHARNVLFVIAAFLWLRMMNMVLFIGILRSGGDTRFGLVLDGFIIWLLGVPLAWMGAFLFHLPVHWVLVLTMSEELAKWGLALWRFFSRKWIHNLARAVSDE